MRHLIVFALLVYWGGGSKAYNPPYNDPVPPIDTEEEKTQKFVEESQQRIYDAAQNNQPKKSPSESTKPGWEQIVDKESHRVAVKHFFYGLESQKVCSTDLYLSSRLYPSEMKSYFRQIQRRLLRADIINLESYDSIINSNFRPENKLTLIDKPDDINEMWKKHKTASRGKNVYEFKSHLYDQTLFMFKYDKRTDNGIEKFTGGVTVNAQFFKNTITMGRTYPTEDSLEFKWWHFTHSFPEGPLNPQKEMFNYTPHKYLAEIIGLREFYGDMGVRPDDKGLLDPNTSYFINAKAKHEARLVELMNMPFEEVVAISNRKDEPRGESPAPSSSRCRRAFGASGVCGAKTAEKMIDDYKSASSPSERINIAENIKQMGDDGAKSKQLQSILQVERLKSVEMQNSLSEKAAKAMYDTVDDGTFKFKEFKGHIKLSQKRLVNNIQKQIKILHDGHSTALEKRSKFVGRGLLMLNVYNTIKTGDPVAIGFLAGQFALDEVNNKGLKYGEKLARLGHFKVGRFVWTVSRFIPLGEVADLVMTAVSFSYAVDNYYQAKSEYELELARMCVIENGVALDVSAVMIAVAVMVPWAGAAIGVFHVASSAIMHEIYDREYAKIHIKHLNRSITLVDSEVEQIYKNGRSPPKYLFNLIETKQISEQIANKYSNWAKEDETLYAVAYPAVTIYKEKTCKLMENVLNPYLEKTVHALTPPYLNKPDFWVTRRSQCNYLEDCHEEPCIDRERVKCECSSEKKGYLYKDSIISFVSYQISRPTYHHRTNPERSDWLCERNVPTSSPFHELLYKKPIYNESFMCQNAFIVSPRKSETHKYLLIQLEDGHDIVDLGHEMTSPCLFHMGNEGYKDFKSSAGDDIFLFESGARNLTAAIEGRGGKNAIVVDNACEHVRINFKTREMTCSARGINVQFRHIERYYGGSRQIDTVLVTCQTKLINTKGGYTAPDTVIVSGSCGGTLSLDIITNGLIDIIANGSYFQNDDIRVHVNTIETSTTCRLYDSTEPNVRILLFLDTLKLFKTNLKSNNRMDIIIKTKSGQHAHVEFPLSTVHLAAPYRFYDNILLLQSDNIIRWLEVTPGLSLRLISYLRRERGDPAYEINSETIPWIDHVIYMDHGVDSFRIVGGERTNEIHLRIRNGASQNYRISLPKDATENTLILESDADSTEPLIFQVNLVEGTLFYQSMGYLDDTVIHNVYGRPDQPDEVTVKCGTRHVETIGGYSQFKKDKITIPFSSCVYHVDIVTKSYTEVVNDGFYGTFTYFIANIETTTLQVESSIFNNHTIFVKYSGLSGISSIRNFRGSDKITIQFFKGQFATGEIKAVWYYHLYLVNPIIHIDTSELTGFTSDGINVNGEGLLTSTFFITGSHNLSIVHGLPIDENKFFINVSSSGSEKLVVCGQNTGTNEFWLANDFQIGEIRGGMNMKNLLAIIPSNTTHFVFLGTESGNVTTEDDKTAVSNVTGITHFQGNGNSSVYVESGIKHIRSSRSIFLGEKSYPMDLVIVLGRGTEVSFVGSSNESRNATKSRITYQFIEPSNFILQGNMIMMSWHTHIVRLPLAISQIRGLRFDIASSLLSYKDENGIYYIRMIGELSTTEVFYTQPKIFTSDSYSINVGRDGGVDVLHRSVHDLNGLLSLLKFNALGVQLNAPVIVTTPSADFQVGYTSGSLKFNYLQILGNQTTFPSGAGNQNTVFQVIGVKSPIYIYLDVDSHANCTPSQRQVVDLVAVVPSVLKGPKYVPNIRVNGSDLILSFPYLNDTFRDNIFIVGGATPCGSRSVGFLLRETLMIPRLLKDSTWKLLPNMVILNATGPFYQEYIFHDIEDSSIIIIKKTDLPNENYTSYNDLDDSLIISNLNDNTLATGHYGIIRIVNCTKKDTQFGTLRMMIVFPDDSSYLIMNTDVWKLTNDKMGNFTMEPVDVGPHWKFLHLDVMMGRKIREYPDIFASRTRRAVHFRPDPSPQEELDTLLRAMNL